MLVFYFVCVLLPLSIFAQNEQYSCGKLRLYRHLREKPLGPESIIGGISTKYTWGWMVSLRRYSNHTHFCGGSIISSSWILTAAHCVYNLHPSDIMVHAGSNNLRHSTQWRSVAQIISHPMFNSLTDHNDIALIQLSSPLNMRGSNLAKICLPPKMGKTLLTKYFPLI